MADLWGIISSNYITVGGAVPSGTKYVAVDPEMYEGSWKGKYADGQAFEMRVSDVNGFRAKVRYSSGATVKYQEVLIRDGSFRIGDSKFMVTGNSKAQIATVVTSAATGASTLEKAPATRG